VFVGLDEGGLDEDGAGEPLSLRNCVCGATLVVAAKHDPKAGEGKS
jgi:hypothetical protein